MFFFFSFLLFCLEYIFQFQPYLLFRLHQYSRGDFSEDLHFFSLAISILSGLSASVVRLDISILGYTYLSFSFQGGFLRYIIFLAMMLLIMLYGICFATISCGAEFPLILFSLTLVLLLLRFSGSSSFLWDW